MKKIKKTLLVLSATCLAFGSNYTFGADKISATEARTLIIQKMDDALSACELADTRDKLSIYAFEQQAEIDFIQDGFKTGNNGPITRSNKQEFRRKALAQQEEKGYALKPCIQQAKATYSDNPKTTLAAFGNKNLSSAKKLLILWESALDSIGKESFSDNRNLFDQQAKLLKLDLKLQ